jgi:hypothetical protein
MTHRSHMKLVGIEPTTSRLEGDNPRSTSPKGKRRKRMFLGALSTELQFHKYQLFLESQTGLTGIVGVASPTGDTRDFPLDRRTL